MQCDGFQRALDEHGDRVHSFAVWMLGDREEARDVVQEAFARLWRQRSAVAVPAARGWLMKTVHRLCVDRLRRRGLVRRAGLDEQAKPIPGSEAPVERTTELSELQAAIAGALWTISPRDRGLIVMREMQEMSYEEMSDVLGMSLNTLKPALHRARGRLRRALMEMGVKP